LPTRCSPLPPSANLLVTLMARRVYWRRRADLDAAGADAVGELHARIDNLRRDEPD
jgi:hypothetical protein